MMKRLFLILAAALAAFSCSREMEFEPEVQRFNASAKDSRTVHFNASLVETKAQFGALEDGGYEGYRFFVGASRSADSYTYYWLNPDGSLSNKPLNGEGVWSDSYWMAGEPSYGEETYVFLLYRYGEERWCFNDVPNDVFTPAPEYSGQVGYIIEFPDGELKIDP